MRGSHSDHFTFFKETFGLGWRQDTLWQQFIEITERRNLFVHTNGIVTRQYMAVCKEHNITLSPEVREGIRLTVPPKYFNAARDTLLELGIKVSQVLWRKKLPSELNDADESSADVTYDFLRHKRYNLLVNLLEFAIGNLKGKMSAEEWLILHKVNLAIAYKCTGNKKKMAECLATVDWTGTSKRYRMAEAVLQERYHDVVKHMNSLGPEFPKANYRDWPLFDDFRATNQFRDAFRSIYQEEFTAEVPMPEHTIGNESEPTNSSGSSESDQEPPPTIQ